MINLIGAEVNEAPALAFRARRLGALYGKGEPRAAPQDGARHAGVDDR